MRKVSSNTVLSSEVAEFLKQELHGDDVVIYGPAFEDQVRMNSIIFTNDAEQLNREQIGSFEDVLIVTNKDMGDNSPATFIVTANPQLDFARVVNHFFARPVDGGIDARATIEDGAIIGENVTIKEGAFVGSEVEIGANTVVLQNVVITGRVVVGENCVLKPNCTIGSELFDFVDMEGQWEQFPQMGEICIGKNVWVGANATIEKGSLSPTEVREGVRIDDLVQIGSSSVVGRNAIVAAGAVICRNSVLGERCWVAPNASILENLKIGNNATIGLGAVVLEDVPDDAVVAGNPAKLIRSKLQPGS